MTPRIPLVILLQCLFWFFVVFSSQEELVLVELSGIIDSEYLSKCRSSNLKVLVCCIHISQRKRPINVSFNLFVRALQMIYFFNLLEKKRN